MLLGRSIVRPCCFRGSPARSARHRCGGLPEQSRFRRAPRGCGGRPLMSLPCYRMRPLVGGARPITERIVVFLPTPLQWRRWRVPDGSLNLALAHEVPRASAVMPVGSIPFQIAKGPPGRVPLSLVIILLCVVAVDPDAFRRVATMSALLLQLSRCTEVPARLTARSGYKSSWATDRECTRHGRFRTGPSTAPSCGAHWWRRY
jgi:hypothetical protein